VAAVLRDPVLTPPSDLVCPNDCPSVDECECVKAMRVQRAMQTFRHQRVWYVLLCQTCRSLLTPRCHDEGVQVRARARVCV
jgi:hypothetical protein